MPGGLISKTTEFNEGHILDMAPYEDIDQTLSCVRRDVVDHNDNDEDDDIILIFIIVSQLIRVYVATAEHTNSGVTKVGVTRCGN